MKKIYKIFICIVAFFFASGSWAQPKNDTEKPLSGSFMHIGKVLQAYDCNGNFLGGVFDREHGMEIFFQEKDTMKMVYSLSLKMIPEFEKMLLFPKSGRYIIRYGNKEKQMLINEKCITVFLK